MIDKITLKFDSSESKSPLEINLTPITVFVGPNNSGKSKILREIFHFCLHGYKEADFVIFENIVCKIITDTEDELKKIASITHKVTINDETYNFPSGSNIPKQQLIRILEKPIENRDTQFFTIFVGIFTILLDGDSRIKLISQKKMGDLKNPDNILAALFRDDDKRKEVRRIVFEAFKNYFVIDPTESGNLRIRLSQTEPPSNSFEKSLSDATIDYYRAALTINVFSDGVKAFTGIIIELIAGNPRIVLIDEPEAFLHPSLANKLGKEAALAVQGTDKNLIVSTHSANFLMGCIHSGTPINIVRLTYYNNVGTARLLPSDKVAKLMRHPLLRSTGALNGLFYDYVIVTESDSDRAFYQEINERLLRYDTERGIPNCLFLNAQNWQTIKEIVQPLREMGIPCAGIYDIDFIKEGGINWTNLLKSAFLPDSMRPGIAISRSTILNKLQEKEKDLTGEKIKDFKTDGGIDLLGISDKQAAESLFDELERFGIFAVRKGELESWLKNLNSPGHGSNWLIDIFEKMGEDPTSTVYVKPGEGDVWDFIGSIKKWFIDPNKKGIPE